MAITYYYPNGNDGGWVVSTNTNCDDGFNPGNGLDNDVTGPNDATFITCDDQVADVLNLDTGVGSGEHAIVDSDTISLVRIKVRATLNASDPDNNILVDLIIGGVAQGTQQETGHLTGSFANYTLSTAGWDSDWTAAQIAGMQVRLTSEQGGMPAAYDVDVSEVEVEITYTADSNHVIDGSQTPDLDPDPLVFTGAAPSAEITHIRDVGIASPSPVFTGNAPSAEITHNRDVGTASPSPTFTGNTPTIRYDHYITPPTGSIGFDGTGVTGGPINSGGNMGSGWGVGLAFVGQAFTIDVTSGGGPITITDAGTGSHLFTGNTPTAEITHNRDVGTDALQFTGSTPTAEITHIRDVGTDAMLLTGNIPIVLTGGDKIITPATGALAFTGNTPTLDYTWTVFPTTATLQFTGNTPTVLTGDDKVITPATGALQFTGNTPTAATTGQVTTITPTLGSIAFTGNTPTVVIVGSGVSITNANATTSVPSNYEQCDYTGFRQMPGSLKLTWNKHAVRRKSYESRHPQDVLRNVPERKKGSRRPEADDRFISDIGAVDAEDL